MNNQHYQRWLWFGCLCLPLISIGVKWYLGEGKWEHLAAHTKQKITIHLSAQNSAATQETWIRSNLPQTDDYQTISNLRLEPLDMQIAQKGVSNDQNFIRWETPKDTGNYEANINFERQGKAVRVKLPNERLIEKVYPSNMITYLNADKDIPSNHLIFERTSTRLAKGADTWSALLWSFFDFAHQIKTIENTEPSTALTALQTMEGNTLNTNRVLVGLCRASGIPARLVSGLDLEPSKGAKPHLWSEIWVRDRWVPFDPVYGHFAYFPATFVKLSLGAEPLQYATGLQIAQQIQLEEKPVYTQMQLPLTWWELTHLGLPNRMLKVLLILPICALVVTLFRNVIGIRTVGTMLPAIVAVSFTTTGLGYGLLSFIVTILLVAGLHFPLERKGLLQTPKSMIMLVVVVILLLVIATIGGRLSLLPLTQIIFFPIIILSIAAERFARTIEEEGVKEAIVLQAKTFLVILSCYAVFQSDFLFSLMLSFPEIYLMILGFLLILGKWGGLRLMEYYRFRQFAQF